MKIAKKDLLWVYAFMITSLAYVFGLFVDLTGDSGLYAAISRQMVETGNWFNLQINGEPYDQKPHLFFWLVGVGIKLFGNTNFAFKIFPFLYGIAGIYFTYRLGKTIYSIEVGKLAALIVGTSQITFLYFFDLHMDSILQTGVLLALWQLAEYLKNKNWLNFVLAFVGVGLAMFSKGPIGAVIPFFAVLFYLISERNFWSVFHPKWIFGILISLMIISPTLIHLYNSFGIEGLKFFFITNNFGRITGEYAGSNTDYTFYLHTLLWAFLPWTFLVVFALFSEVKSWFKKERPNSWGYYLLGSTLVLLLVLSIAKGKAPNYFLIAVAPISVITAHRINHLAQLNNRIKNRIVIWQIIFIAFIGAFLGFLIFWFDVQKLSIPVVIVLLSAVAILLFTSLKVNMLIKLGGISIVIIASLNLYLNLSVFPELYKYQGAKQALAQYQKHRSPDDTLYNLHLEEFEIFFYTKHRLVQIHNNEEYRSVLGGKNNWVYTTEEGYKGIMKNIKVADELIIIKYRGMNEIKLSFLNPRTRENSLRQNYLIKVN